MKIGMFTNYYYPSWGGLELSVANLCAGLKNAGHETFIFAPQHPNWKDKEENIFRYKSIHFNYNGIFYAIPVPFLSKIKGIVSDLNLDIIHSHHPFLLGKEALKFSKKMDIPLVVTHHSKYEDHLHYIPFIPKSISKKYIKKAVVEYSNKCDAVIAPSMAMKKILRKREVKIPIEVIPSGINIENFRKDTGEKKAIRNKYKIGDKDILLTTASRISEEKNMKFLLEAFAEIKKKADNIKFLIVGDGALKNELEEMSKELHLEKEVIFTGLVPQEKIAGFYQASDIFVFASLVEAQGLVAVEAMAAGLPVVAIKASGIENMVENGRDGILTGNSRDEFSNAVLKVASDEDLRKKLSAQAKIGSEKFSVELWIRKMVELYERLLTD
ncbi:MAG: glycosyltransferase [Patescibacteria group bacterium]|nr:glycosyltransferase [Patescibacteria group bacterium]